MPEIQIMMTAILVLSLCIERAFSDCPNLPWFASIQPDCVKICETRRPTYNAQDDFKIPCKDLSEDERKTCKHACAFCNPNASAIFGDDCCFDLDCPKKPTPPPPPPPPPSPPKSTSSSSDTFLVIFLVWLLVGVGGFLLLIIVVVIVTVCLVKRLGRNQYGRPVQPGVFQRPAMQPQPPGNSTNAQAVYPNSPGDQPHVNAYPTATSPQTATA